MTFAIGGGTSLVTRWKRSEVHGWTAGSGRGGIPRNAWRSKPAQSSNAGLLNSISLKPWPSECQRRAAGPGRTKGRRVETGPRRRSQSRPLRVPVRDQGLVCVYGGTGSYPAKTATSTVRTGTPFVARNAAAGVLQGHSESSVAPYRVLVLCSNGCRRGPVNPSVAAAPLPRCSCCAPSATKQTS